VSRHLQRTYCRGDSRHDLYLTLARCFATALPQPLEKTMQGYVHKVYDDHITVYFACEVPAVPPVRLSVLSVLRAECTLAVGLSRAASPVLPW
jgi:hypothetical protein